MDTDHIIAPFDNTIDWLLVAAGRALTPAEMARITRVQLTLGATTLDSNTLGLGAGQPFDLTGTTTWDDRPAGVLRLRLGGQATPSGLYRARLVVYDPDHPNGLLWTETRRVQVVAAA